MKNRLKTALKSTGLEHLAIAKKIGVAKHDISNMSAGRKQVTIDFALLLEKHFNINPCWLFFNRGSMTAKMNLTDDDVKILSNEEISYQLQYLTNKLKEMSEDNEKSNQ